MHRPLKFGINSELSTGATSIAVVGNNSSGVVYGMSLSMKAAPQLIDSNESSTNGVATDATACCRKLMPAGSSSRGADT
jgi:hypothetical protein